MSNGLVSIIILNWNKKELLKKCLESIKSKTRYESYEVVVVDNNSEDGSVEMLEKDFDWINLIKNEKNYGFAKGNNIGIRYAEKSFNPSYLLLLNNDIEVLEEGWLENLVETCSKDDVGIVGCKLLYPDGGIQHAGAKYGYFGTKNYKSERYFEPTIVGDKESVVGASFFFSREVLNEIGYLDEGFSPYLFEETDYCIRAKKAGFKIAYDPRTELIHHGGASWREASEREKDLRFFYRRKNLLRLILLNFSLGDILLHIPFEFYWLVRAIFEKKNKNNEAIFRNIKLRKTFFRRLKYLFKSYWINMKDMRSIIGKRYDRTKKVEFNN